MRIGKLGNVRRTWQLRLVDWLYSLSVGNLSPETISWLSSLARYLLDRGIEHTGRARQGGSKVWPVPAVSDESLVGHSMISLTSCVEFPGILNNLVVISVVDAWS